MKTAAAASGAGVVANGQKNDLDVDEIPERRLRLILRSETAALPVQLVKFDLYELREKTTKNLVYE